MKLIVATLLFLLTLLSASRLQAAESLSQEVIAKEFAVPPKAEVKPESEIPLFKKTEVKKAEDKNLGTKTLLSVILVLGLAAGGFLFVRRWSKKAANVNPQTQIKIITQHYLSPKKSLAIIRVAGESILIGVTESNISLIKPLALLDEEVPEQAPDTFVNAMSEEEWAKDKISASEVAKAKASATEAKASLRDANTPTEDEFSFGNIKDAVAKKLENLRSL